MGGGERRDAPGKKRTRTIGSRREVEYRYRSLRDAMIANGAARSDSRVEVAESYLSRVCFRKRLPLDRLIIRTNVFMDPVLVSLRIKYRFFRRDA